MLFLQRKDKQLDIAMTFKKIATGILLCNTENVKKNGVTHIVILIKHTQLMKIKSFFQIIMNPSCDNALGCTLTYPSTLNVCPGT